MTAANRNRVLALYGAYARGDLPHVLAALTDDVRWQSEGSADIPWAGLHLGAEGVRHYFAVLARECEVLSYQLDHVIADGEWVVALASIRLRYSARGTEHGYAKADALRLRNGLLCEFREYYDTSRVLRDWRGS
nr:nuclear transport factor 2 family protein [Neoroseomonas soli]